MGREAKIEYADGRERVSVKAHLDSANLQLSGGKKLILPLVQVKTATVEGDALRIVAGAIKFSLKLGAREAELWRKKILNPPSLADKLGLKAGLSVLTIGKRLGELDAAVADCERVAHAASVSTAKGTLASADVALLVLAPNDADRQIAAAAKAIGAKCALWLVYAKGVRPNGDDIIRIARALGLKDTKVARISDTHAGLRFIRGGGK